MSEITQEAALAALRIGLDKAKEIKEPSCVCVVDAGGNLLAFARGDNATFGCGHIAMNKAYTSASFVYRTEDLYADSQPGGELYGLELSGDRPYVIFGGGIPILRSGKCVGAVGVSGGPVEADLAIAGAMAEYLENHT